MGRSLTVVLGAALALASCKDRRTPPVPAPSVSPAPSAAPPAEPLPERAVSGEAAFELLALDDGALLAWGGPTGLAVAVLDAAGRARGEPLAVPGAPREPVVEIAGASLGSRVGLAWASRSEKGAASFGALGDAETRAFSSAFALSDATLGDVTRRGHVALAVSDKAEMVALVRVRDEPCSDSGGPTCAQYRFRELLPTGVEPRGLPMSVPSPCAPGHAGLVLVKDRWHYGFCSEGSGQPEVTTFMRQLSPFYVGVAKPAPGCTPLGALRLDADALFVFQCGDAPRAVRIGGLESGERSVDLSRLTLECVLGRPRFTAPGLALDLSAAASGLGPLLPVSFGGGAARAAWTGSALLVASWVKGRVSLRRYECRGAELARTG